MSEGLCVELQFQLSLDLFRVIKTGYNLIAIFDMQLKRTKRM
jgi:hypothetical protein